MGSSLAREGWEGLVSLSHGRAGVRWETGHPIGGWTTRNWSGEGRGAGCGDGRGPRAPRVRGGVGID
ncbi:hypothetical protein EMIHUDRAFT_309506 [Emiliania huxleyi CCMP1516]|uniref:Uncharacterized protein n=2 Tax=Emiliania huxleyi TaxID=2903 RepID=A0A0D3KBN9_EMIH1|nr:hypothetical protein EMIHUDRAFT_309506 [Emiliania huxleyi CCMP1516]EOD33174.1 hypothetical protein EMIHUDRAFT_309506 [Emiliania huxleyi CCMP1516]|eukprot:XP_005785603.1 hypothetical protein EMIHUDRAFT_309506 [Emiliania huxleyi CCMP1516]